MRALGVSGGTMIDKRQKHEYAVALVEWIAVGALTQAEIEEEVHAFAKDFFTEEPILAWDYLADVATERGITSEMTEVRA